MLRHECNKIAPGYTYLFHYCQHTKVKHLTDTQLDEICGILVGYDPEYKRTDYGTEVTKKWHKYCPIHSKDGWTEDQTES